ncbi:MAG: response regulator [Deltaproteobacteria bacterium]|nr:response regulator [Deltaproteobacteria bacterium]
MSRFSLPLEATPVASLFVDANGLILEATPAASRLIGAVDAQSIAQVAPTVMWTACFAAAATGEIVEEASIRARDGERAARLSITRHEIGGVDVACVIITERPEVPDPGLQRLESLGLVAGGIAHDFNNLLVGVLAEASAAREEVSLSESMREALRRIEAAARRMSQLTRQLLAFAGRAQFVTVPIGADDLLGESRDSLGQLTRPGVSFAITPGAPGAVIEADSHLLRQVFANLVANASDAATSKVSVTTRLISRDTAPYWQLEISDDGEGIDVSVLPRIFEPFFSTKSGHHGLGLSAVHGIVRRLGGDVEVDTHGSSHPQHGARFRVRLPIVVGAAPTAPTRHTSEPISPLKRPDLQGVRALVADDEPSVRATVRRLLERRGATVVVAADGSEAEARLHDEQFQLVISDVEMPGKNGFEVLAIARGTQRGARIVLMSGYTEKLRGSGSEDEADAFLEKPFTAKGLDAIVNEVLKGR